MSTINPQVQDSSARLLELLASSARRHRHLCPRQVLGARMGLLAGRFLGLEVPRKDKRLLVFVETDGCFADGVSSATGSALGHRTIRLEDYGRVAATFADTQTGRCVRIAPHRESRRRARALHPERDKWSAYLEGYQTLTDDELFTVQEVRLRLDLKWLIGSPGQRIVCADCGEEVLNGREIERDGRLLCPACAGPAYYEAKP